MLRSFDQLDSAIISFELMEMKHFKVIVVKDNWLVSFKREKQSFTALIVKEMTSLNVQQMKIFVKNQIILERLN